MHVKSEKLSPITLFRHIVSFQSAEEVYKRACSGAISKEYATDAIVQLCERSDPDSIQYQIRLFRRSTLLAKKERLMDELPKILRETMKSTSSTPLHQFSTLLFLARLQGSPFEFTEEFLYELFHNGKSDFLHTALAYQTPERFKEWFWAVWSSRINNLCEANLGQYLHDFEILAPYANQASLLDLIYTLFDLDKPCIDTHQTSLFDQYQEEILAIFLVYPGTHLNQLIRTAIEAYPKTASEEKRTGLLCIVMSCIPHTNSRKQSDWIVFLDKEAHIFCVDTMPVKLLNKLGKILPYATEAQRTSCIETIISTLFFVNKQRAKAYIQVLIDSASYLTVKHIATLAKNTEDSLREQGYHPNPIKMPSTLLTPSNKRLTSEQKQAVLELFEHWFDLGVIYNFSEQLTTTYITFMSKSERACFMDELSNQIENGFVDGDFYLMVAIVLKTITPTTKLITQLIDLEPGEKRLDPLRTLPISNCGLQATLSQRAYLMTEMTNKLRACDKNISSCNYYRFNPLTIIDTISVCLETIKPSDELINQFVEVLEKSGFLGADQGLPALTLLPALSACYLHATPKQKARLNKTIISKLEFLGNNSLTETQKLHHFVIGLLKPVAVCANPLQMEQLLEFTSTSPVFYFPLIICVLVSKPDARQSILAHIADNQYPKIEQMLLKVIGALCQHVDEAYSNEDTAQANVRIGSCC